MEVIVGEYLRLVVLDLRYNTTNLYSQNFCMLSKLDRHILSMIHSVTGSWFRGACQFKSTSSLCNPWDKDYSTHNVYTKQKMTWCKHNSKKNHNEKWISSDNFVWYIPKQQMENLCKYSIYLPSHMLFFCFQGEC